MLINQEIEHKHLVYKYAGSTRKTAEKRSKSHLEAQDSGTAGLCIYVEVGGSGVGNAY